MSLNWTTPRDWVTDEIPTAAILNTHIRDNLNAVAGIAGIVSSDGTGGVGTLYSSSKVTNGTYLVSYAAWSTVYLIPSVVSYGGAQVLVPNLTDYSTTHFQVEWRTTDVANSLLTDTAFLFSLRPAL